MIDIVHFLPDVQLYFLPTPLITIMNLMFIYPAQCYCLTYIFWVLIIERKQKETWMMC